MTLTCHELLSALLQGVRRLFVLAFHATGSNEACIKDNKKYFPRGKTKN